MTSIRAAVLGFVFTVVFMIGCKRENPELFHAVDRFASKANISQINAADCISRPDDDIMSFSCTIFGEHGPVLVECKDISGSLRTREYCCILARMR